MTKQLSRENQAAGLRLVMGKLQGKPSGTGWLDSCINYVLYFVSCDALIYLGDLTDLGTDCLSQGWLIVEGKAWGRKTFLSSIRFCDKA